MQIRAGESDREMIGALGVDIRTLYTARLRPGRGAGGSCRRRWSARCSRCEVGMGEPVLILAFVVIIIGGIGSVKGALVGADAGRCRRHPGPGLPAPALRTLALPPAEATTATAPRWPPCRSTC